MLLQGAFKLNGTGIYSFLTWLFSKVLKDILILFLTIFISEWIADKWGCSRFEKAWWITLAVMMVLVFFLWARWGRMLLW
jgi:hypothetical protein